MSRSLCVLRECIVDVNVTFEYSRCGNKAGYFSMLSLPTNNVTPFVIKKTIAMSVVHVHIANILSGGKTLTYAIRMCQYRPSRLIRSYKQIITDHIHNFLWHTYSMRICPSHCAFGWDYVNIVYLIRSFNGTTNCLDKQLILLSVLFSFILFFFQNYNLIKEDLFHFDKSVAY